MNQPSTIEADLSLTLITETEGVSIPTSLVYFTEDPYAVRLVFSGGGIEFEWVFARDLLRMGLSFAIGDGDVHVRPGRYHNQEIVMLSLCSPDGQAVLRAPAETIRDFLQSAHELVPAGQEDILPALNAWLLKTLN